MMTALIVHLPQDFGKYDDAAVDNFQVTLSPLTNQSKICEGPARASACVLVKESVGNLNVGQFCDAVLGQDTAQSSLRLTPAVSK